VGEFSTPFDEFERSGRNGRAVPAGSLSIWVQAGLRGLSVGALWVAILTASFMMVRRALPMIVGSESPISLKSGVPLIAIGDSYFFLIVTLRRTLGQRLVGILIGMAFMLWGSEQFLSNQAVISFIDDVVVFLFVVDLSIVIRHNLRNCAGERLVRKASFPVVKTIENFNFAAQPSIDEAMFGPYFRANTLSVERTLSSLENLAPAKLTSRGRLDMRPVFKESECYSPRPRRLSPNWSIAMGATVSAISTTGLIGLTC
jgi:hypothetical protein